MSRILPPSSWFQVVAACAGLLAGALSPCPISAAGAPVDARALAARVIKRAEIDPAIPVFVPVHPRIATTISFPKPIGEPVGTGFVDSEAANSESGAAAPGRGKGDYVIAYVQGDPGFTVQPSAQSELLNLNVPYEGRTIVLYFYLVESPLEAVASLVFAERGGGPATSPLPSDSAADISSPGTAGGGPRPAIYGLPAGGRPDSASDAASPPTRIQRAETRLIERFRTPTPARLEGFLRKLRAIHAARLGSELDDLAAAMRLSVAVSTAELPDDAAAIPRALNAGEGHQLILLRVARDPALDAVGFVVLFRNTTQRGITLDLRTLSARCGGGLYTAQVVDGPVRLGPGELKPGYFVIVGTGDGRPGHLLANNDWRLSVAEVGAAGATAMNLTP
jgi:hypothetical protein